MTKGRETSDVPAVVDEKDRDDEPALRLYLCASSVGNGWKSLPYFAAVIAIRSGNKHD